MFKMINNTVDVHITKKKTGSELTDGNIRYLKTKIFELNNIFYSH